MAGIDKSFDYAVPDGTGPLQLGAIVRVPLHGRRVAGWVVGVDPPPLPGVRLRPLLRVSSVGPAPDVVDLAHWAARRWAGRLAVFLRAASPPVNVSRLPPASGELPRPGHSRAVVRLPPAADWWPVVARVEAAARTGQILILCPSVAAAASVAARMRREGRTVALLPRDWARAAAGAGVVVGVRAGAWATVPRLGGIVVLDAHDQAYQEERAPTWRAWDVAAERARRVDAPCVLVSPCPTLEQLDWGRLEVSSRHDERAGWTPVEIIDRRRDDPRSGWLAPRLVDVLRDPVATAERPVVCVLNRKGRARLLACAACGSLATCARCGAAVRQGDDATAGEAANLVCGRCRESRPLVCLACGAQRFKNLRPGVTRLREEIEALANRPVAEVTGDGPRARSAQGDGQAPEAAVLVGTEAVLHRVSAARAVAFLDFDQELLAPRYRAGEDALALLARAARLTGGRAGHGRLLVQTRVPDHDVLAAALHADPGRWADAEGPRRAALGLPPARAVALLSGPDAEAFAAALGAGSGRSDGLEILGPDEDRWLVKARDHESLGAALGAVGEDLARPRIEVDPARI